MGPQAAPLFLFLFSLTLLRILLAFELKSTSSLKKKIPQFYLLYSNAVLWPLSYQVSKADRWKELKKQIRTTPDCAAWADHYQSDAKVRKTYQMCVCVCVWSAVFEMTSGDRGVVLVCVTAGAVFLWRTERSALPLRLVINGYRFITSSQSAMLPACPTLLVTQSDW